jgi:hypothetical protein
MTRSVSAIATLLALGTCGVLGAQGCGGREVLDVADGQTQGVVGEDGSSNAISDSPPCPAGPPWPGKACALVGQECLYSAAGGGYCGNVDAICSSSGYWQSAGVECPNPGCPSALPGDGNACSQPGLSCIYPINASVCSAGTCGSVWTCGQLDCESAGAGVCSAMQCGCDSSGVWHCGAIECQPPEAGAAALVDAPSEVDAACSGISAASFDQSCTQDSDCVRVAVGACDDCNFICGLSFGAISAGAEGQYETALEQLPLGRYLCGCPDASSFPRPPLCCVAGQCHADGACIPD